MAKQKQEYKGFGVVQWDTMSMDGFRVKHRLWRERRDGFEECIFHLETRLTNDPVTISHGISCAYEVYPRQFFDKVWIAQRLEFKRASTWKLIGAAVETLERQEAFDEIKRKRCNTKLLKK